MIISRREMLKRIDRLSEENSVLGRLFDHGETFDTLPKHLQEDALKRVGLQEIVEVYYRVIGDNNA